MRTSTRILVAAVVSVLAFGAVPANSASAKTIQYAVACCGGR